MQMVLNTPGLALKTRDGAFEVAAGEERRIVSPQQLESIAVTAPCLISSSAIELAIEYDLSIYFFNEIGDAVGCLRSPYFESIATLRRKQVYFSDSPQGGNWVILLFRLKTAHQIDVLEYLANRRPSLAPEYLQVIAQLKAGLLELESFKDQSTDAMGSNIMGWEGHQARMYWKAVSMGMPDPWKFNGRSRRPAEDGFNAMLNYLYGMMYTIVEQALFAAGLDPHLGILHSDEYDRPTLAFDLIEPFRPWVDQLLAEQFMSDQVKPEFFDQVYQGWRLNAAGKKFIIPMFNAWLEEKCRLDGKQFSRKGHIYRYAAELAQQIQNTKI